MAELMKKSAVLSSCGSYRYRLTRRWDDDGPEVAWVMLNPSTADATENDPTIRKCLEFSRRWGFGGLTVVNLFAWRATDPRRLDIAARAGEDIVGPDNADYLGDALGSARLVVAAWGAGIAHARGRGTTTGRLVRAHSKTKILGLTKVEPRHPLMLAYSTPLVAV